MKRLERALEVAMEAISVINRAHHTGFENLAVCKTALAEIDAILHPVEVEDIPLTLWWVASQPSGKRSFEDEALALRRCRNDEKPIPLQTTIRREKKVVKRSMTVEGGINVAGNLLCAGVFKKHPECHGKRGTLTFEWTE